jgi:L-asparaginase
MNRRILLVALGGTIAMTGTGRGVAATMTADDILAAVPGLDRLGVDLETITFRNQPSASLSVPDLLGLYELIAPREAYGVVVTQGTDTLEETAYALDLLHDGPFALVMTGAMRNPTLAGADGPANVLAAVAVAASPDARDLGCLVVASDEIHAARRVRKTHSTSVATFASPDGGPLGYLVEGVPRFVNRPARRSRSYPPTVSPPAAVPSGTGDGTEQATLTYDRDEQVWLPRVGVYTATLGDDGALLEDFSSTLDGLVIAAFGVGHVHSAWPERLSRITARIPVVLASRTGAGPVLRSTYDYPGSELDLLRRGLIPAGFLHPYKARLLLQFLLSRGAGREQIIEAFATEG